MKTWTLIDEDDEIVAADDSREVLVTKARTEKVERYRIVKTDSLMLAEGAM